MAWGGLAALALLGACEMFEPVEPVLTPKVRPAGLAPPQVPDIQATSQESAALRSYLAQVQSSQLTSGLLRQDGGGPDTPFTSDMLARNFEEIVFFNEYAAPGVRPGSASALRRWTAPVRIGIEFGPSVPPSQRTRDTNDVIAYARRLAQATGHPISVSDNPNFLVFFVSEDDRAATLNARAPGLPGVNRTNLAPVRNLPGDAYCAVAAYASGPERSTYTAAVAVIRAENPDLLRLSCIHEELAQGLGLANDSPDARPSIFNDDDEFALLTGHDVKLLGMLYDKRLRPGIGLAEAKPIVRTLAAEATSTGPS
ncbi:DUF2927 domain-containing protein [Tateyamaria sp. ANG-S1]|uniref:DUF2927 domain-containing protein n=1 Tax=Tateyamaria sp. ANG-S1 TaxID=1577905 RepID=UPI00057D5503|nr:DUF2927 domain-containing protein [Tateyamaria sp. ANG-S1]KIC50835.1 hypothetical protein RA29_02675 [Tateyamaria sp. ANG-S1]